MKLSFWYHVPAGEKLIIKGKLLLLKQLKQELMEKYGAANHDIMVLPMDLNSTDIDYLRGRYQSILNHFGVDHIDILINNAGFSMRSYAVDFAEQDTVDMVTTNLTTPIVLTKMVLQDIIKGPTSGKKPFGHIVNISSVAARYLPPTRTSYVATKSGLLGYGYALFEELKEHDDVCITTICPGAIQTNVDIAARGKGGKGHGKRDGTIQSGMSVDRCAELICIAVANKIHESWPMKQPSLTWFYRCFWLSPSSWDGRSLISMKLRADAGYIGSKL